MRILIHSPSDREKDPGMRLMWGDYWVKRDLGVEFERLGFTVVEDSPDLVLHLFGAPPRLEPPPRIAKVVWLYSHPDLVTPDNLKAFDLIFCSSKAFVSKLKAMRYGRIEVLPPLTAKQPVSVPVIHSVIFLGNARKSRPDGRAAVRDIGLCRRDFKVWGARWERHLPAANIGGEYWDYDRLGELYASALTTLNDHHRDMAREGFVSNKVFDILASGGFVISDRNMGLDDIFGRAAPQYETVEELSSLVDFYLTHPREREELMFEGRKIALAHSYGEWARRLVEPFL